MSSIRGNPPQVRLVFDEGYDDRGQCWLVLDPDYGGFLLGKIHHWKAKQTFVFEANTRHIITLTKRNLIEIWKFIEWLDPTPEPLTFKGDLRKPLDE